MQRLVKPVLAGLGEPLARSSQSRSLIGRVGRHRKAGRESPLVRPGEAFEEV
jgi:hypothetical protein